MAEFKLELLTPAWAELEAIADLHLNWSGINSAEKITNEILDSLELLKSNPYLGMECCESVLKKDGYRKLICSNYISFYKVIEKTIYVYHIIDGRTNYPKLFEDWV